jgi:hypothetical protein
MPRMLSGQDALVQTAFVSGLNNRLNKRGQMQKPELTLKIEMFGNLIEELNYWHYVCEHEQGDQEFEYAELMFEDSLAAVREMREVLLEELNEYKMDCRATGTPIDISYFRIEKQLKESTFSHC